MKIDKHLRPPAFLVCAAGILLVVPPSARSQSGAGGNTTQDRMTDRTRIVQESAAQAAQAKGVALESTIDPRSYYVGPSDVIAVSIWMTPPVAFVLTVTPEGTLIIPTVGEVRVADTTLAAAKSLVLAEVKKRYKFAEASVTLVTPRSIVVTVTGNVLNHGSYVLTSTNRMDKAIEEANRPRSTQSDGTAEFIQSTMSTRNILVRRKDGSTLRVDIVKFFATKEDRWNPYLREGDVLVVPRNDFTKNVVAVYGEVNAPGRFEYVEGDSIKDILRIAYGFTRSAVVDSAEFSRLDISGQLMSQRILDAGAILDGKAPDVPIRPGDRVVVRGKPDMRSDYRVKVTGEVFFPGVYPITRSASRLSDVVRAAGGFTQFASLGSSVVLRQSVRPSDIATERLESIRGGVPSEDSIYYYLETDLRIQKEAVNVDFRKLFVEKDSTEDVILQDEDHVVITSLKRTIYVFGQVVLPGNVSFIEGQTVGYYVDKAGGFTDRARKSDVKIVKARTRQWLSPKETKVEEGDYVWVPKETEYPFSYYMSIIGQTAAILSVAVSVVLLVIQTNK